VTLNVTKSVIGLKMGKAPIKVNEHFVVITDDKGNETKAIYSPPLLAESQNIRVELRKEKNHNRPHVHIIKKGSHKSYDVSIALDNFDILAGGENLKHFAKDEYQVIIDFIVENQDRFIEVYATLRGEL
jgi:hypothetical protein